MKMRIALLLALIVALASLSQVASACTIFNAMANGLLLVGNNEEHSDPNGEVRFEPSTQGKYGKVTFAFGPFTQGGMNEQGLFYDCFAPAAFKVSPWIPGQMLPSGDVPDKQPTLAEMMDIYTRYDTTSKKMLESCATLDESIEFYQQNYEGIFGYAYLMIVDKTGASATLTWDWEKNQLRVNHKSGSFQVIGSGSEYIFPRLNEGNREISVDYFKDLLKNTSIDGSTAYSNIYDLQQGVVYVYNQRNFGKEMQFNLEQELTKGKHSYYLKDLF